MSKTCYTCNISKDKGCFLKRKTIVRYRGDNFFTTIFIEMTQCRECVYKIRNQYKTDKNKNSYNPIKKERKKCICGVMLKIINKKHLNSKTHLDFLNNNN